MPIQPFDTGRASAEELRAVPQRVDPDVYAHLARKAVYPMTLPFHRPLELARAYLGHLGTTRTEIMEVFRTPSAPSTLAQVVERLVMSPAQYEIVAGAKPADPAFNETDGLKDLWAYYGYASSADLSPTDRGACVAAPDGDGLGRARRYLEDPVHEPEPLLGARSDDEGRRRSSSRRL